jgi:hypothetical protein
VFGRLPTQLGRIWSNKIIKFTVYVVTSYILFNIIGGIIGNSSYTGSPPTWMKSIWEQGSKLITTNLLIITSTISVVSLIGVGLLASKTINLSKALNATTNLTELDDSLNRLLANLLLDHRTKSKEQLEKEMRRLLHELLRDATQTVLGKKNKGRAAILFPIILSSNGKYLIVVASHRFSGKSADRTRFYIGEDESKEGERGTVGVCFLQKQMRIGHIIQKDGYRECDDEDFIDFDDSRSQLTYQTFVNVPIIGIPTENNLDCLGVICLDTKVPNGFDSSRAKTLLEAIARRVAAALSIYIHLMEEQNYSVPYFSNV